MKEINISEIEGISIGNAEDVEAGTGCSVVICSEGAACGVDVRGGAPGTRETDLLSPVNLVDKVHAVVIAGGSAFGLDASGGVMKYLEEKSIGFDVLVTKVPIVCSAVLFDLTCGDYKVRPDAAMGYRACENSGGILESGSIGAGCGATVGKVLGMERAMKGGLGTYALQVGDLKVGAMVAVNCFGDVIDTKNGEIIAGALGDNRRDFVNTEEVLLSQYDNKKNYFSGNTTLGVIVTNGSFNKTQCKKISSMAHNAYGRTMRPAHTMFDGDTIFSLATGKVEADINSVGLLATRVMEEAIIRAIKEAGSLHGFLSYKDR